MKRINTSFLGNASHISFSQLIISAIATVEMHGLEDKDDAIIKLAFEHLKSHQPDVLELRPHARSHDLQDKKETLNRERKDCGYLITHTLKAKLYSKREKSDAAKLLNWIKDVSPKFPNNTISELTRSINIMRNQLSENAEIAEMIDRLGIREYFDDLFAINDQYDETYIENIRLFSQKNKSLGEKREIRKKSYEALRRFIDSMEWSIEWFGKEEHRLLYIAVRKLLVDAMVSEKLGGLREKKSKNENGENEIIPSASNNFCLKPQTITRLALSKASCISHLRQLECCDLPIQQSHPRAERILYQHS